MKSDLYTRILAVSKHQGESLVKHLRLSRIYEWEDITTLSLNEFVDYLRDELAPSSVKTLTASLSAFLKRYKDEGLFSAPDFDSILRSRGDKPVKTYLTDEELERFERVACTSDKESFVKLCFFVGSKTGMRYGDIVRIGKENIRGGVLTYTAQKTLVTASIPVSERTERMIGELQDSKTTVSLVSYNDIVRRLARRAGIVERVAVHHAGKDEVKEKCECLSSHSARITFATNLALCGMPIIDISRLCGHSNTTITERYIVPHEVHLNEQATRFLR